MSRRWKTAESGWNGWSDEAEAADGIFFCLFLFRPKFQLSMGGLFGGKFNIFLVGRGEGKKMRRMRLNDPFFLPISFSRLKGEHCHCN